MASGWRLDGRLMRRLIRLGGPGGLQLFMEVAAFTAFVVLVGRLGPRAMAATNLAFNVNTMAWMPVVGLGTAVTAMVGQELGRNEPRWPRPWSALGLAMLYMGTMALLYLIVPDAFLFGHAAGTRPEESPVAGDGDRVAPLRGGLLPVRRHESGLQQRNQGGGRHGVRLPDHAGDRAAAGAGHVVGRRLERLGTVVVLDGRHALGLCVGLIYLGRFLQGRWREMRVIEPERSPRRRRPAAGAGR